MKTVDCVHNWVSLMMYGQGGNKPLRANSCHANGCYFVSYNTPVAKFVGGVFEVATKKYSVTTSKLQTYIRNAIPNGMLKEVYEITDNGEFCWRR